MKAIRKHLTNKELIEILSQRNPNEEVNILVDYSTCYGAEKYSEIKEQDGVCFVEEDNQLVINNGEFEC